MAAPLLLALGVAFAPSVAGCSEDDESTGCPARQPSYSGTEECSEEGVSCGYGQECCCGSCYTSYECTCRYGTWSCYYTDACYMPMCGGSGGTGASGGAGGTAGTGGTGASGGAGGVGGTAGAGGATGGAGGVSGGSGGTAGSGGSAGSGGATGRSAGSGG